MKRILNIDLLEFAYKFEDSSIIEKLENEDIIYLNGFALIRLNEESNYKNNFSIVLEDSTVFGKLYFKTYNVNRNNIYISINNNILYINNIIINNIYNIQNNLKLEFIKVSKLDLALDFNYNMINKIYKLIRNKDIDVIILNKNYEYNDDSFKLLNVSNGSRQNLNKYKGFYILNKEKGMKLCAYNKSNEIKENNNEKEYISDYNNFKNIYRLEIRTRHKLLKDSLEKIGFTDVYLYQIILNKDISELLFLYENLLSRLIRIRIKNKVYSLLDFI